MTIKIVQIGSEDIYINGNFFWAADKYMLENKTFYEDLLSGVYRLGLHDCKKHYLKSAATEIPISENLIYKDLCENLPNDELIDKLNKIIEELESRLLRAKTIMQMIQQLNYSTIYVLPTEQGK